MQPNQDPHYTEANNQNLAPQPQNSDPSYQPAEQPQQPAPVADPYQTTTPQPQPQPQPTGQPAWSPQPQQPVATAAPAYAPQPVQPEQPIAAAQPTPQPGFAPQPLSSSAAAPAQNPGKTLGIVSLVTSLIGLGIVGLITGILGIRKSSKAGMKNGLALAGIIISSVGILLFIPLVALVLVAYGNIQMQAACTKAKADGQTLSAQCVSAGFTPSTSSSTDLMTPSTTDTTTDTTNNFVN